MSEKIHLSRELIEQIIFGMENQKQIFYLDLEKGMIEEKSREQTKLNENQLVLPAWKPSDGFLLMEQFASSINNPVFRDLLLEILHSGKGVFRKFKNLLTENPKIEKIWFSFKRKKMESIIFQWLETYQDYLDLSLLGNEKESLKDLILSDFSLVNNPKELCSELMDWDNELWEEVYPHIPEGYRDELFRRYRKGNPLRIDDNNHITAYLDSNGQVAAFIWFSMDKKVMLCRSLYTLEPFRGMGLATELVSQVQNLAEDLSLLMIEFSPVPNHPQLEKFFHNCGFSRQGCGFILELPELG